MPYGRVKFIDAAPGGLGTYSWQVNYAEEEAFGIRRNIEETATSDGIHNIRQQGTDESPVIRLNGTILHQNQHQEFIQYFYIGRARTIIFVDFEGHQYEVMPVEYKPVRKRTMRNPRDNTIRLHYFEYGMELSVVRVISGPWMGFV